MQRRELLETLKAVKGKVHKLNKSKRSLQEEVAKNFATS
jgi:hypothetical protein